MFTRRVVPFKDRESYQIKEGIVRDWSDMEKFFNSATVSCEEKPSTKDDMVDIMCKTYNQCPAFYIAVMEEMKKYSLGNSYEPHIYTNFRYSTDNK